MKALFMPKFGHLKKRMTQAFVLDMIAEFRLHTIQKKMGA